MVHGRAKTVFRGPNGTEPPNLLEKPHTGLDDCLIMLLPCFRNRMSDHRPLCDFHWPTSMLTLTCVMLVGFGVARRSYLKITERVGNFTVTLLPELLTLKHKSRILRHSSNPVCGFFMMEQDRLCAVWPMENWLGSSQNQIQDWTTVRESYSRALEQGPLVERWMWCFRVGERSRRGRNKQTVNP